MEIIYSRYLAMNSVPAGKILDVILTKKNISRAQLAKLTGIYPQRISEYINGRRNFTIEASVMIEKALDIDITGFFVKCQMNYEVHEYCQEQDRKNHPDFDIISDALFWDTRKESINWATNKKWVVRRAFEYGNDKEIIEIIRFYGKETIRQILSSIKSSWHIESRNSNYNKYILE